MSRAFWRSPIFVLVCATTIILLAYGGRQSFGMFLRPVSTGLGWGNDITVMSLATGLQSLVYGLATPFVGAIADRWGPIKVLVVSGIVYAAGLFMMAHAVTPEGLIFSVAFVVGLGSSGVALPMLLSVASRVAPPERRGLWLGIVTSGGTAGQMLVVPFSHGMIASWGWVTAALVLGGMVAMIVPLSLAIARTSNKALARKDKQSLGQAVSEARRHRGFWLLTLGFFVCGFQVQFINNHLESYLRDTTVDPAMAATAISLIGLFNMIGTWCAGAMGERFSKKYLLANIYMLRSLVFLAFFLVPVSKGSVIVFACAVGLLWLATVPLTSGIVVQIFGPRYLATLYGVVFLSHQIGSFASVSLGGYIRTHMGSYDAAWWMVIIAGFVAALLHWPIDDKPVARIAAEQKEAAKA